MCVNAFNAQFTDFYQGRMKQ